MNIKTQSRAIVATLTAALAITAVDMRPVAAASVAPQKAEAAIQASDATEFSSQRRHYRNGGYRGGNRVAAGAIIGAVGAVAGLALADSARRNYYRNGYYDYGYQEPAYGYAEPYAYQPAPYYAPYGGYGPRNEYFPN
jgi:hypothetical protein